MGIILKNVKLTGWEGSRLHSHGSGTEVPVDLPLHMFWQYVRNHVATQRCHAVQIGKLRNKLLIMDPWSWKQRASPKVNLYTKLHGFTSH
jgi:hypothetical protein